ncbi:MAG: hypothetical protein AAGC60_28975 [Acidobacteriota bacterium]
MISSLDPARQRQLAIALVVLLVVLVGWRFGGESVVGWLRGDDPSARRAQRTRLLADQQIVDVRLDALGGQAGTYQPDRNLFRYGEPPRQAPPPRSPRPLAPPPPVVAPPPPEPTITVPRPPPVSIELIGIFGPERRRIAVFRDGEEIVNALRGDEIKNQFILNEIGFQSVVLGFVGFPDDTERIVMEDDDNRGGRSRRR